MFDANEDGTVYFAVQAVSSSGDVVFNTRKASGIVYETVAGTPEILVSEYIETFKEIISSLVTEEVTKQLKTISLSGSSDGDGNVSLELKF